MEEATIYFAETGHDRVVSCLNDSYDKYITDKLGEGWEVISE